jgi:transposase
LRARCTNSKFRQISRYKGEELLDEMAARLEARPDVLNLRRESVEHPFGSIKQWMGQKNFLMRRLDNVRAEFSLTALAYNIRRVITLLGIPAMIAAVRA